MISEASVRRAINHLGSFGDTDLERPGTIAKDCESLNIGQYTPVGVVETLTPKSWLGFRIAHQLTAAGNVIYLAALLDCAPKLEAARLPKDDNEAFAYRFAEGESVRIFEPARGYHQMAGSSLRVRRSRKPVRGGSAGDRYGHLRLLSADCRTVMRGWGNRSAGAVAGFAVTARASTGWRARCCGLDASPPRIDVEGGP